MADNRLILKNQLEKSILPGSLLVTNASNLANYLAPGANGTVLGISSGTPSFLSLTADNGLSKDTDTNWQLGGNLIKNTTITNNGFSLTVSGTTSSVFQSDGKVRINNTGTAPAGTVTTGQYLVQIGAAGTHATSGVYINSSAGNVGLRLNLNSYATFGDGNIAGINTCNMREEGGVFMFRSADYSARLSLSTNPSFNAPSRFYNQINIIPNQHGYTIAEVGNSSFNVWAPLNTIPQQQGGIRILRGVLPTAAYFTQYIQSSNNALAWNKGVQGAGNNDTVDQKVMELTTDGRLGVNTTSSPLSNLEVNGSVAGTITTHNTANPVITEHHTQYFTTGASGTFTLTGGAVLGRIYYLINYSGVNITLSSNIINGNGSTTNTLNSNARFQIQWNGSNWILLSGA